MRLDELLQLICEMQKLDEQEKNGLEKSGTFIG